MQRDCLCTMYRHMYQVRLGSRNSLGNPVFEEASDHPFHLLHLQHLLRLPPRQCPDPKSRDQEQT